MRAQIIASLLLAVSTTALQAEDTAPTNPAVPAAGETIVEEAATGATATQLKTFGAGNQMLIDVSAEVSDSLEARLEREVGGEFNFQARPKELLVSGH